MKILFFASAREKAGFSETDIPTDADETPRQIVARVSPALANLSGLRVAVDYEYWGWDTPVGEGVELAIIPPVSGG